MRFFLLLLCTISSFWLSWASNHFQNYGPPRVYPISQIVAHIMLVVVGFESMVGPKHMHCLLKMGYTVSNPQGLVSNDFENDRWVRAFKSSHELSSLLPKVHTLVGQRIYVLWWQLISIYLWTNIVMFWFKKKIIMINLISICKNS